MENPEAAAEVFSDLDDRFGAIFHLAFEDDIIKSAFKCYGDRIFHMHLANAKEDGDSPFSLFKTSYDETKRKMDMVKNLGFKGSISLEFVKFADSPEGYYKNAYEDFKTISEICNHNHQ